MANMVRQAVIAAAVRKVRAKARPAPAAVLALPPMGKKKRKRKRKRRKGGAGGPERSTALAVTKYGASIRHAFDPAHLTVPPSLTPLRQVFPVSSSARLELDTLVGLRTVVFVSAWGGQVNPCMIVTFNTTAVNSIQTVNFPVLSSRAGLGGASSSKICKVGFRLTNTSSTMYRGGRFFLARLDQRIRLPAGAGAMSGAQWDSVVDTLKALPDRMLTPFDAASFASGGHMCNASMYCGVDDEVDYALFENHEGAYLNVNGNPARTTIATDVNDRLLAASVTDWFEHVSIGGTGTPVEKTRPMSTLVLIMEPPPDTNFKQNLNFEFAGQYLTRWPIDTIPGQQSRTLSASSHEEVTKSREAALTGINPHPIIPGYRFKDRGTGAEETILYG